MKTMRVCETKYLGPKDHRGSRVKATHVTTRKSVTLEWDPALDSQGNHALAAQQVLGGEPHWYASVDGGGYLFGRDPSA